MCHVVYKKCSSLRFRLHGKHEMLTAVSEYMHLTSHLTHYRSFQGQCRLLWLMILDVCLSCGLMQRHQRRIRGGRAPYFWQSQFYFLHCIQCLKKIFLKLNFDFIVAEIRGVFGSEGGVCVCVSVWSHRPTRQISRFLSNIGGFRNRGHYCFFCSAKAQFWMISVIPIKKIYARLQEIASNFLQSGSNIDAIRNYRTGTI